MRNMESGSWKLRNRGCGFQVTRSYGKCWSLNLRCEFTRKICHQRRSCFPRRVQLAAVEIERDYAEDQHSGDDTSASSVIGRSMDLAWWAQSSGNGHNLCYLGSMRPSLNGLARKVEVKHCAINHHGAKRMVCIIAIAYMRQRRVYGKKIGKAKGDPCLTADDTASCTAEQGK